MQVKILPRTGRDLFNFLEASEVSKERAFEEAITNFVLLDGSPMTLEDLISLPGDKQIILKGRIFTLQIKGIQQNEKELRYKDIVINRKEIKYNLVEKAQTKIQRINEKGGSTIEIIKLFINEFYEISLKELEELPYEIAAYMFSHIDNFFRKTTLSETEFNLDDI